MVKALVLAAALFATAATAAETEPGGAGFAGDGRSPQGAALEARPARPRRTVIHFGEDDIRGGITRPDGELVQAPRKAHEDSLLRVRRSFADRALSAPIAGR